MGRHWTRPRGYPVTKVLRPRLLGGWAPFCAGLTGSSRLGSLGFPELGRKLWLQHPEAAGLMCTRVADGGEGSFLLINTLMGSGLAVTHVPEGGDSEPQLLAVATRHHRRQPR